MPQTAVNRPKHFTAALLAASAIVSTAVAAEFLPPPAGYTRSQLIFNDAFASSSLDQIHWNPWLGDPRYGRWNDFGKLPNPYSGGNCPKRCSTSYQIMYDDPYPYGFNVDVSGSHLLGGPWGLSIQAAPSSHFASLGYSWAASAVSTASKTVLPATGGYVQWHAKMPDSRYGAWGALWLLSADGAELDVQESGYIHGADPVNNVLASAWHGGGAQIIQNAGFDLSAAFHTYGVEYRPGQSWKVYLDGKLMAQWTTGVPTNAAYELIMDMEIAGPLAAGWHTVADARLDPGPFIEYIDDVQIYKLP